MNAEVYSEWLCRQGHTVVRTPSSHWHSQGLRVYQSFPYHRLIEPHGDELREFMSQRRAVALRYSMPAAAPGGVGSYHAVYTSADYGFETLSAWARKNVRRGLRLSEVSPISFRRYVEQGWELRADTLARQGRRTGESREGWQKRYALAADLPGFEVWAAEVRGKLAATLVVFQMEGWYYMLYQQCHREYLREHVNNALSFTVTRHLAARAGFGGIFYGMQSLDAPSSVDEFKFRMGYVARPVRQRAVFHPWLAGLVHPLTNRVVQWLAAVRPSSHVLAKAGGMLRAGVAEKRFLRAPAAACQATAQAKS
jgi:hypothetical protein